MIMQAKYYLVEPCLSAEGMVLAFAREFRDDRLECWIANESVLFTYRGTPIIDMTNTGILLREHIAKIPKLLQIYQMMVNDKAAAIWGYQVLITQAELTLINRLLLEAKSNQGLFAYSKMMLSDLVVTKTLDNGFPSAAEDNKYLWCPFIRGSLLCKKTNNKYALFDSITNKEMSEFDPARKYKLKVYLAGSSDSLLVNDEHLVDEVIEFYTTLDLHKKHCTTSQIYSTTMLSVIKSVD